VKANPGQIDGFTRRPNESARIWLEEAADLEVAEMRVKQLLSFRPGEYQLFDLLTKQVVLNAASPLATKTHE
jgi:hypothetical protein